MASVPTRSMERELKKLYLAWVKELPEHPDPAKAVEEFREKSTEIIRSVGGETARRGAMAGFPAPRMLELSPKIDAIYNDMHQAVIKAGIATGLNSREIARSILLTGTEKSYKNLERLARTEVVSAYWRNRWDSVEGLGFDMVWSAEKSARTCPYCLSKHGMVVTDKDLRDHPNGRCTLVPKIPSDLSKFLAPDPSYVDRLPQAVAPTSNSGLAFRALWQTHATALNSYWRSVPASYPPIPDEILEQAPGAFRVPGSLDSFFTHLATDFAPLKEGRYVWRVESGDWVDLLPRNGGLPTYLTPLSTSNDLSKIMGSDTQTVLSLKLDKGTRTMVADKESGELLLLPGSRLNVVSDTMEEINGHMVRHIKAVVEPPIIGGPYYSGGTYSVR